MDKQGKQALLITLAGIAFFVALNNIPLIGSFILQMFSLAMPVVVGGIIALFINVPMSAIDRKIQKMFQNKKRKPSEQLSNGISMIITLVCIICVIVLVCTLIIPEIINSVKSIAALIEKQIPVWINLLEEYNLDYKWLEDTLSGLRIENLVEKLGSGVGSLLNSVIGVVNSSISFVTTAGFALIIAIYLLLEKKVLTRQTKKIVRAYFKESVAEKILSVGRLFYVTFAKFLSGQSIEALVLGVLMFLAFEIFNLPYAALVGVITATLAMIPYVGAFFACVIAVLLTCIAAPEQVIKCTLVYLITQFIENQFIYPRVVGSSVGLSPLWILLAALLGGDLFGVIGILFFIPITAVLYILVKRDVNQRLKNKNQNLKEENADMSAEADA